MVGVSVPNILLLDIQVCAVATARGEYISSLCVNAVGKPGVLGSIPGDCRPFHFPLFSPHITSKFSLFQHETRVLSI